MAPEARQRLLNALANELEDIGVRVTHLAMSGAREQFDIQYQDLEEPPAIGGKALDLQGQRWESTHIGVVDTSVPDLRNVPDLGTFVSYVVRNPSVSLHVAVPFEHRNWMQKALLGMTEPQICHRIWVWPFRESGRIYAPEPKLRVG